MTDYRIAERGPALATAAHQPEIAQRIAREIDDQIEDRIGVTIAANVYSVFLQRAQTRGREN